MVVTMATTNLFWHPVFKDDASSANDPAPARSAFEAVGSPRILAGRVHSITEVP